MTGLDKIIEQIKFDTNAVCESIIKTAQKQADSILKEAEMIGDSKAQSIQKKTEQKINDMLQRADSTAQLEIKKAKLTAKQNVIKEMLEKSKSYILNLPDNDYFDLILKMIFQNSLNDNGEILFCKRDLNRLPEGFSEKINSISKGKLSVSNKTINQSGGFILNYGGIEENCTFDAIFISEKERLYDNVSHLLFA